MYMKISFNPKVKNFLKDNSEMTVLGLAWAIIWRVYAIIFCAGFIYGFISIL